MSKGRRKPPVCSHQVMESISFFSRTMIQDGLNEMAFDIASKALVASKPGKGQSSAQQVALLAWVYCGSTDLTIVDIARYRRRKPIGCQQVFVVPIFSSHRQHCNLTTFFRFLPFLIYSIAVKPIATFSPVDTREPKKGIEAPAHPLAVYQKSLNYAY